MYKKILVIILSLLICACSNSDNNTIEIKEYENIEIESDYVYTDKLGRSELDKSPQELYSKCIACHGLKGDKVAPGSMGNVLIARLSKDSISDSLKKYRERNLSKGGNYAIMYLLANELSDEDIDLLSEYISNFSS